MRTKSYDQFQWGILSSNRALQRAAPMTVEHLPQITYFYEGSVYPFIGDADLKTLIRWRKEKEDSGIPIAYNKDARNTYFQHMACMEQCIRILFSNPTPEHAQTKLQEREEKQKNLVISRLL